MNPKRREWSTQGRREGEGESRVPDVCQEMRRKSPMEHGVCIECQEVSYIDRPWHIVVNGVFLPPAEPTYCRRTT